MRNGNGRFAWDAIGDIALGRPNLGPTVRLEMYRLLQFSLRSVLEADLGTEATNRILREAGRLAGRAFAERFLGPMTAMPEYVRNLQARLREYGIGIMRMEEADAEAGRFVLTIEEDMDCSGLPEMDTEVCQFVEGSSPVRSSSPRAARSA